MDYAALTQKLVADAIGNKLPGLTKTVTLHYFVSDGGYDAESDSNSPVYNDVTGVVCIAAKPTFADVQDHGAVFTDTKLVIPGTSMPAELQVETDKVTLDGKEWQVRKCVGVPGRSVFLVFVLRT
jgi:hypothetical protein